MVGGSHQGRLTFYAVETGQPDFKLETKHPVFILSLAFSLDGKWLACGTETGSVLVFDVGEKKLVHSFTGTAALPVVLRHGDFILLLDGRTYSRCSNSEVLTGRSMGVEWKR